MPRAVHWEESVVERSSPVQTLLANWIGKTFAITITELPSRNLKIGETIPMFGSAKGKLADHTSDQGAWISLGAAEFQVDGMSMDDPNMASCKLFHVFIDDNVVSTGTGTFQSIGSNAADDSTTQQEHAANVLLATSAGRLTLELTLSGGDEAKLFSVNFTNRKFDAASRGPTNPNKTVKSDIQSLRGSSPSSPSSASLGCILTNTVKVTREFPEIDDDTFKKQAAHLKVLPVDTLTSLLAESKGDWSIFTTKLNASACQAKREALEELNERWNVFYA
eukprot:TRINITY_DN103616_c0_g1_i1.p2 TRINITY_DN103616_c0_g1~~TRINITY_DN103616_c0_g1_i1.p2  ORF type:complete len:278 (-),score=26.12 TRINITY_DN103616_c0_g1_i1:1589-2422(-)